MEEITSMKIGERGQIVEFMPEKDGIKLQKKKHYVSPVKQVFGILDGK